MSVEQFKNAEIIEVTFTKKTDVADRVAKKVAEIQAFIDGGMKPRWVEICIGHPEPSPSPSRPYRRRCEEERTGAEWYANEWEDIDGDDRDYTDRQWCDDFREVLKGMDRSEWEANILKAELIESDLKAASEMAGLECWKRQFRITSEGKFIAGIEVRDTSAKWEWRNAVGEPCGTPEQALRSAASSLALQAN